MAFYKEELVFTKNPVSTSQRIIIWAFQIKDTFKLCSRSSHTYIANEKPNQQSRFSNPLQSLNYSIQSLLLDGLNKELVRMVVKRWLSAAYVELTIRKSRFVNPLDETQ